MSYWQGKNVFITGCTGFIGSWLTAALVQKKARVVGLVRDIPPKEVLDTFGWLDKITAVYGSVEDYFLVERILGEYRIDTCFHLSAQSQVGVANENPLPTFRANILGTWNVLEACRRAGSLKRIVVASSDKVYGEQDLLPYVETQSLNGVYPYDASKVCADVLARCYHRMYQLPIAVTRLANVYAGGDFNFKRIVPDTIRSLIFNKSPVIRSDGTYLRDYMYVTDAVRAYLMLAEALDSPRCHGEVFNFGPSRPIRVKELVERIIKISGKRSLKPKILDIVTGEIKAQHVSSKKAKEMLGWTSQVELSHGLSLTYRWYKDFFKKTGRR